MNNNIQQLQQETVTPDEIKRDGRNKIKVSFSLMFISFHVNIFECRNTNNYRCHRIGCS